METKEIRVMRVRRFVLTSDKPFERVALAFQAALGRPDMAAFNKAMASARTGDELQKLIQGTIGASGFMEFVRFDLGAVLSRDGKPENILRFVIGNPLIMKEMAKHVHDAASYAPVTVLIDERPDGVHLSYDLMADYLAPYENAAASKVARELDEKVEKLMTDAA